MMERELMDYLTKEVGISEEAAIITLSIGNIVSNGPGTIQANPAVTQLVWDVDARAREALRRVRERAGESAQAS